MAATMEDRGSTSLQLVLDDAVDMPDASVSASCSHIKTIRGHVAFTSVIPINIDDVSIYFEGGMRKLSSKHSLSWFRCL